jgi:hypothetical protein
MLKMNGSRKRLRVDGPGGAWPMADTAETTARGPRALVCLTSGKLLLRLPHRRESRKGLWGACPPEMRRGRDRARPGTGVAVSVCSSIRPRQRLQNSNSCQSRRDAVSDALALQGGV